MCVKSIYCSIPAENAGILVVWYSCLSTYCRKPYPYWHLLDEFTARYSIYYHFTVRPSAASGWTDGGARVREISLVGGLQAQIQIDLCR